MHSSVPTGPVAPVVPRNYLHLGHKLQFLRKPPLNLSHSDLLAHVAIAGRTPSADDLLADLLRQQTLCGGGWIRFLPCHEHATLALIAEQAVQAGRSAALSVLNFDQPDEGSYSPLFNGTPADIATHLLELLPPGYSVGADYYRQKGRYFLEMIVDALQLIDRLSTVSALAELLESESEMQDVADLLARSHPSHPAIGLLKPPQGSSDIRQLLGGLSGRIAQFAQGRLGLHMAQAVPSIDLDAVVLDGQMLAIVLPPGHLESTVRRMLISHIVARVRSLAAAGAPIAGKVPFMLAVEEPTETPLLWSEDFLRAAKALGVGLVLRCDSLTGVHGLTQESTRILFGAGSDSIEDFSRPGGYDLAKNLGKQKSGEFHLLRNTSVVHGSMWHGRR